MVEVVAARSEDLAAAFGLLFQHLPAEERGARVGQAIAMVGHGDLRMDHVLVALGGGQELCGVLVCLPLPGASGLFWPPQAQAGVDRLTIEDQLVQTGLARLRQGGAKLAQAILFPADVPLTKPLVRNGFQHVTQIAYLRHSLQNLHIASSCRLTWQTYEENPLLFTQVLARSYEGTRDCPELNGIRTMEEVVAGHRGQGIYHPDGWLLAFYRGEPVGVVLLMEVPDLPGLDLAYVGVVREARRQGLGRALVQLAMDLAARQGAGQLTLSLDVRNLPARKLYDSLGFEQTDLREVFLCFLAQLAPK